MTDKKLIEALEKSIRDKPYEELVRDGAAMERLINNKDFQVYQRLMAEQLAQLVMRMKYVAKENLPEIQGALIHHDALSRLPAKVFETASRVVRERRGQEEENETTFRQRREIQEIDRRSVA